MVKLSFGLLLPLIILFLVPHQLQSQITITSSDILQPVGYKSATEQTDYGSHTVDLGSPGGPRTWDFTSYSTPFYSEIEVVDRAGTPFGSEFPTANMAVKFNEGGETGDAFQYWRVESNLWSQLGFGVDLAESSFVVHFNPVGDLGLPIAMGNQYLFEIGMVDTIFGAITSTLNRSRITVDAYGTMIIPMGSFAVLRTVSYDTSITTVSIPPFEFSDTTTTIEYGWMGRDPLFVAEVSSMEGETNPNFTTAAYISVAANPSGIGDGSGDLQVPKAFRLEQNAPNPFNPQTNIAFTVSGEANGDVELSVFTIRGSKVKTLVSGRKSPGEYVVSWDGRDESGEALPSGIYLYRLTTGGESQTRKMILAK